MASSEHGEYEWLSSVSIKFLPPSNIREDFISIGVNRLLHDEPGAWKSYIRRYGLDGLNAAASWTMMRAYAAYLSGTLSANFLRKYGCRRDMLDDAKIFGLTKFRQSAIDTCTSIKDVKLLEWHCDTTDRLVRIKMVSPDVYAEQAATLVNGPVGSGVISVVLFNAICKYMVRTLSGDQLMMGVLTRLACYTVRDMSKPDLDELADKVQAIDGYQSRVESDQWLRLAIMTTKLPSHMRDKIFGAYFGE